MLEMLLGSLSLASNLFLSPLAGYTSLPFRLTVRELGGLGLATTDLVNARSLLEKKAESASSAMSTTVSAVVGISSKDRQPQWRPSTVSMNLRCSPCMP